MFFRKKIDFNMINPSSKMALKMSCLQQTNGDVRKAEELYNFLADGIESMPDYPTQKPSTIQQVQQVTGSVFNWFKENQGDILNAINFVKSLRGGQPIMPTPIMPSADIPPLPTN